MSLNTLGEFYATEDEAIDILYNMPEFDLSKLKFADKTHYEFNQANKELRTNFPDLIALYSEPLDGEMIRGSDKKGHDEQNQQVWFMPEEYAQTDIESLVLKRCQSQAETDRTILELLEYKQRNLYPLLQYLNYMVDTLRANNIVWGVGRGSSVASFVLYLLGVHKVDSLAYNLDPYEFFR